MDGGDLKLMFESDKINVKIQGIGVMKNGQKAIIYKSRMG